MKCYKCGKELSSGEVFCGNCGNRVASTNNNVQSSDSANTTNQYYGNNEMNTGNNVRSANIANTADTPKQYCAGCGAEMSLSAKFCENCGYSVNGEPGTAAKSRESGIKIIVAATVAAVVVALGIFVGYALCCGGGTLHRGDASENTEIVLSEETPYPNVTATARPMATSSPATPSPIPSPTASAPLPTPWQTTAAQARSVQYLFNSDSEYITTAYLDTKSRQEVRFILNEIYARHGYIFNLEQYSSYFEVQSWYFPKYTSVSQAEAEFNNIEKANKETIVNYEISKGWR